MTGFLWTIVSILVGIVALLLIINLFVGIVKLAFGWKIFSGVVAIGLIVLLVYIIGWLL